MKRSILKVIVAVSVAFILITTLIVWIKGTPNKNFTEKTVANATTNQRNISVQIVKRIVENETPTNRIINFYVKPNERFKEEIFDWYFFPNKKSTMRDVATYDVNFYTTFAIQSREGYQLLIGAEKFCMPVTELILDRPWYSSSHPGIPGSVIPIRGKDAPELIVYIIDRLRREGNTFRLLEIEGPMIEFEEAE